MRGHCKSETDSKPSGHHGYAEQEGKIGGSGDELMPDFISRDGRLAEERFRGGLSARTMLEHIIDRIADLSDIHLIHNVCCAPYASSQTCARQARLLTEYGI